MSRTVCSWCRNPLVLKDDVLVCKNIDCDACDEKFLHEEISRLRTELVLSQIKFNTLEEKYNIAVTALRELAHDNASHNISINRGIARKYLRILSEK